MEARNQLNVDVLTDPQFYVWLKHEVKKGKTNFADSIIGLEDTTALLHEVFLKLASTSCALNEDDKTLLQLMGKTIRHKLIDLLREASSQQRSEAIAANQFVADQDWLLQVNEVIDMLAKEKPKVAHCVELYYLLGLTKQQIALALDVSERTIHNYLDFFKSFVVSQQKV